MNRRARPFPSDPSASLAREQPWLRADQQLLSEQPTHSEDGVDLTLIRWMLSMTPAERLETLQQRINSVLEVRAHNSQT